MTFFVATEVISRKDNTRVVRQRYEGGDSLFEFVSIDLIQLYGN